MNRSSIVIIISVVLCAIANLHSRTTRVQAKSDINDRIVVAYVVHNADIIPDPTLMTHINYAFGDVAPTFDSIIIKNPERLKQIVELRELNPNLKIVLSVGGWTSGNFSEMAGSSEYRKKFAADCRRKIEQYKLDGIDIDWEYPTAGEGAGISSSPDDTKNYTLMMRDIRKAIGKKKLLTLAGIWSAKYIDFKSIMPYVDFVNIMSYDMTPASKGFPHNPLYESPATGARTVEAALKAHLAAGIPREKLVLGLPFYGRGVEPYPDYMEYKDTRILPGTEAVWDSVAQSVYMVDSKTGSILMGFENPASLAAKLHYINTQRLRGAMYWEYSTGGHVPARQVADSILRK